MATIALQHLAKKDFFPSPIYAQTIPSSASQYYYRQPWGPTFCSHAFCRQKNRIYSSTKHSQQQGHGSHLKGPFPGHKVSSKLKQMNSTS